MTGEEELAEEAAAVLKGTTASFVRASKLLAAGFLKLREERDRLRWRVLQAEARMRRTSPAFEVVCDASNNSPEDVAKGIVRVCVRVPVPAPWIRFDPDAF